MSDIPQEREAATEAAPDAVERTIKIVSRSTQRSLHEQIAGSTAKLEANKDAGVRSYMNWWALVKAMKDAGEDTNSMVRALERWLREVRAGQRGKGNIASDLDARMSKWLRDAEEVPPRRPRTQRTSFVERRVIEED